MTPSVNPYLVRLRDAGLYSGSVEGGYFACPACIPLIDAELAKQEAQRAPQPVGIPVPFAGARLSNYINKPGNASAIREARSWLKRPDGDLYLVGPVASGKTRLACSLLHAIWAQTFDARFVRVPLLLTKWQRIEDSGEVWQFDVLAGTRVLVLDDVGSDRTTEGTSSDYGRRMLQTLYDARLDVGLRTIWTSNLSLTQLAAHYLDERLPSRIAGAAVVVELAGTEWRHQQGKQRKKTTLAEQGMEPSPAGPTKPAEPSYDDSVRF